MNKLEQLYWQTLDLYAEKMNNCGAMHIFMKECATGYIQSFNIRAACAGYLLSRDEKYLYAVKSWAELSIRLQGSYGDPAAYNMGYLYEAPDNKPVSWFCADTLDQAFALLNIAFILEPDDPLYIKILNSVLKYEKYIQRWNLGENGFAVGYIDGTEPAGSYHTAVTRAICFYASMLKIFSKEIYRIKGKKLLNHLLDKLDMDSNYHGSPLHNRCYASDALACGYYILANDEDIELKEKIIRKMEKELLPWAVTHQTPNGFWAHDRFGYQPGATPPLKDISVMGAYSWGMVAGFQLFANDLLKDNEDMQKILAKAFSWLENNHQPGTSGQWGYHGWAMLSVIARFHAEKFFPFNNIINKK